MLLHPTRLGPYEILAPIGAGGMGVVYRAQDSRLERQVAIKVLPEHLSQSPQALARFVREAKAIAALSHPNILAIFDTGVEDGISYAVTELLEGESLRASLRRGPLAWRKAVEIGIALAEGLAAAHAKGITHRDLKPENIFVVGDGRIKILDFGLARMEVAQPSTDLETETAAGTLLGTPAYMSPEQVRGIRAGPASDIFSFGCVLYEMISGTRAFPGQSAPETMSAILRDQPSEPAIVGVDLPDELVRLIFRCLEKNCEERFQSARELAFRLRAIENSPISAASQVTRTMDSIAVLPFGSGSNDPDSEYLCDGITESILNSLAKISQLRVIPRSSVFRYKMCEADPQMIGRELNVRLVMTGRIIQRGDNLVASAELLDVAAGCQLWGERYHRKISDIFVLEEEIADKISESLRMKLGEKKPVVKRSTENTEAYQHYLRGRHHWAKRTPDRVRKGVDHFQKAIEKDPSYALAYSGLADCYSILGIYSILPSKETLSRAKAAAVAAVAFDEEMPEGHTSVGFVKAYLDWDWCGAEKEFRCALELNPGYWVTRYWYGIFLTSTGRYEEAEEQIRYGMELEPLSPVVMHGAAWNALALHRYDLSIERCMRGLESDPDSFLLRFWLGMVYEAQAKYQEAIQEFQTAVDLCHGGVSYVVGGLGHAYAISGNQRDSLRIIEELLGRAKRETIDLISVAVIYAGLGDTERALTSLEKACDARGMSGLLINGDPRYGALRSEPRFQQLLRRLNLA